MAFLTWLHPLFGGPEAAALTRVAGLACSEPAERAGFYLYAAAGCKNGV